MANSKHDSHIKTAIYEARQELAPYLQRLDLEQLSKHNQGYLTYASNPVRHFIDSEIHVYIKIVEFLAQSIPEGAKVIDIGFFIPVIPIALAKLGFKVVSIEKLAFYDHALDDIIAYSKQNYDIELHDLDILQDDIDFITNQFDIVILSAIIEHLNGTPKYLIEKAKTLGVKDARYIFVVPNVATMRKRLNFLLRGLPPFPPISNYYHSAYPFTGHNREYTLKEYRYILEQSGFEIIHLEGFNRLLDSKPSFKDSLWRLLAQLGPKSFRESLLAVTQKL
jgi:2-polyprenyl-3-methyl-5-hydroxy-6-metoxy-1,4-benzoquinol methylase